MLVGIDGQALFAPTTGIGVYVRKLMDEMLAMNGDMRFAVHVPIPAGKMLAFGESVRVSAAERFPERVALYERRFPPAKLLRWIWGNSNFLPLDRTLADVDLYHGTNFVMPPLRSTKGVVTIYDLIMLFPDFGAPNYSRSELKRYIDRADVVIAISEHTKQDVIDFFQIPAQKLRVTLLAPDERFRIVTDHVLVEEAKRKFGIQGDYILYTGTLEPRKNVANLVRAFSLLKNQEKISHRLVIAGKKGWLYEQLAAEARDLGIDRDVVFTGFVPDEDLPCLYNGASLFAFPSLYEGFGLPPLEAMACGCPVVTSNSSSLPEVVGDAGLMVDPRSPEGLAEAMGRVLGDSGLANELREKGLRRAAEFSWRRCAAETLAVYRELL